MHYAEGLCAIRKNMISMKENLQQIPFFANFADLLLIIIIQSSLKYIFIYKKMNDWIAKSLCVAKIPLKWTYGNILWIFICFVSWTPCRRHRLIINMAMRCGSYHKMITSHTFFAQMLIRTLFLKDPCISQNFWNAFCPSTLIWGRLLRNVFPLISFRIYELQDYSKC